MALENENAVVAQKAKQVGDDATADVVEVSPDVVAEKADAQVAQPREKDAAKVNVNEVSVATDEVITDPSDPRAVQVPDAGKGSLELPLHAFVDGERVEDVFSREASSVEQDDDVEPAASAPASS